MARTRRHSLQFDSLEGKVLLSTGMADPAAVVHQQKAQRFLLNGKISVLPSGSAVPNGYIVSSFPINGHLASMGNVHGAFFLKYSFIPIRKLPDLSKSSLLLVNQYGSVNIALNATGSHHYKFTIMSGSGAYTFASGGGKLIISATHDSPYYTIKMQSNHD